MTESVHLIGLALVCETCENEIDFPDENAEAGICRQCGMAFLIDAPERSATRVS